MARRTGLPKMTGWVDALSADAVWVRVFIAGDPAEYSAEIPRHLFGADAQHLRPGSLISRPHRRDAKWGLAPIRPWTDAQLRRIQHRATAMARSFPVSV